MAWCKPLLRNNQTVRQLSICMYEYIVRLANLDSLLDWNIAHYLAWSTLYSALGDTNPQV